MLVSNRYEIFTNYEVMRGLSVQFISLEDEKFINSVDFYLSAHANGFTFLLRSRFLPFPSSEAVGMACCRFLL